MIIRIYNGRKNIVRNYKKEEYIELIEKIFDNSILPIAILDKNFDFIRVNKAYALADNRQPDEFVGQNHFNLYPSEENEAIFKKVLETKKPFVVSAKPFIYANNPARGITYWDWSLEPIADGNGEVFLLILTLNDVTERIAALKALKKEVAQRKLSEAYLKTIFDKAMLGIITMSDKAVVLDANQASQEMFGYSKEECLGIDFSNIIHPDDIDKNQSSLSKLINKEIDSYELEIRFKKKGRRYFWGLLNTVVACNEQTGEKFLIAFIKDMTDRKKMLEEIIRMDRLNIIGEIAVGVSHEIRNPMTTIKGFLQILRAKDDCSKYRHYYDLMIEELHRVNTIISEFLSIGSNSNHSVTEKYNLNLVLSSLEPLIQADAASQGKRVIIETSDLPDLDLNIKEIRQLILNLCRNGLEAMTAGGSLIIRTYVKDRKVILSIQDEGCGINPEAMKNIGKPFFTTKEKGVGLGLCICYGIASRHNAEIYIDTGENGTTVNVEFTP